MSSTIIDETVILRYLLDDDEVLSPRAAKVIATRTARVYPEIITRVVVTLRDVYKVPRVEIAAAMKRLLDDVMVDEPTVVALAVKLFGKTHMDFTDCLLAARTAIYNDDVVSFGKPIIQGMIDYRRQRQTAADASAKPPPTPATAPPKPAAEAPTPPSTSSATNPATNRQATASPASQPHPF